MTCAHTSGFRFLACSAADRLPGVWECKECGFVTKTNPVWGDRLADALERLPAEIERLTAENDRLSDLNGKLRHSLHVIGADKTNPAWTRSLANESAAYQHTDGPSPHREWKDPPKIISHEVTNEKSKSD